MIRSFKYRLHPNKKQEQTLNEWLIHCGQLYNAALEHRIKAYKYTGKNISKYDQHKELTELRALVPEWRLIYALVQRSPINNLDRAFRAFFRRCKNGEKPGFPRFKPSKSYKSFTIGPTKYKNNKIHIPKLGHVKFNLYRSIEGEIKTTTIKKDSIGNWWVIFTCIVSETTVDTAPLTSVGVDLGLTSFATLSTGEEFSNMRLFREKA